MLSLHMKGVWSLSLLEWQPSVAPVYRCCRIKRLDGNYLGRKSLKPLVCFQFCSMTICCCSVEFPRGLVVSIEFRYQK